jgi:hypothetical protein
MGSIGPDNDTFWGAKQWVLDTLTPTKSSFRSGLVVVQFFAN